MNEEAVEDLERLIERYAHQGSQEDYYAVLLSMKQAIDERLECAEMDGIDLDEVGGSL